MSTKLPEIGSAGLYLFVQYIAERLGKLFHPNGSIGSSLKEALQMIFNTLALSATATAVITPTLARAT